MIALVIQIEIWLRALHVASLRRKTSRMIRATRTSGPLREVLKRLDGLRTDIVVAQIEAIEYRGNLHDLRNAFAQPSRGGGTISGAYRAGIERATADLETLIALRKSLDDAATRTGLA